MKRWKLLVLGACCLPLQPAWAINWLMLQSVEPVGTDATPKLWGFAQIEYQNDTSDPNATGGYIPSKLLAPEFRTQKAFNVSRVRVGVRGRVPDNDAINYFLLTEFGNNAVTYASGRQTFLTDASVTFNHIPHARVRTGLFKTPSSEEGLLGVYAMDYIEFSNMANFLLLERPPNVTYTANSPPADPQATGANLNGFTQPVAGFRDVGVQVFDAIVNGNVEITYAAMMGNGNGLNMTDNDTNKDLYGYLALENIFGGQGTARESGKVWLWVQDGKRTFDGDNNGYNDEYDRDRRGIGAQWRKKPFRATFEYTKADGMVFLGPDKPSFDLDGSTLTAVGDGTRGKGNGWYLEGGWRIRQTSWELDARYDLLTLLEDDTDELEFKSYTLGVQYFFTPKVRFTVNATERDWTATKFDPGASFNGNLDGVGRKYAAQVTVVF